MEIDNHYTYNRWVKDNQVAFEKNTSWLNRTKYALIKKGDAVNLEFDMIGKYIQRIIK